MTYHLTIDGKPICQTELLGSWVNINGHDQRLFCAELDRQEALDTAKAIRQAHPEVRVGRRPGICPEYTREIEEAANCVWPVSC